MNAPRVNGSSQTVLTVAIVILSVVGGMVVSWCAPGLELNARDWMMRMRGNLPPPAEVVIVAIDEASIARIGRFPWRRGLMARGLETIMAARPRAIALDVLYTESSDEKEDRALADAIARAGNVVVAAQLTEMKGLSERGLLRCT